MKFLLKSSFLLTIVLVAAACSSEESIEADQISPELSIPKDATGLKFGNITLPEGTMSQMSDDNSKVEFSLPDGVYYIADVDGEFVSFSGGCYQCSSSCAEGCDVVKFGDDVGCSRCETGFIEKCVGESCDGAFSIAGGGLVDLNRGIQLAEQVDYNPFNEPAWETLMQHPIVSEGLDTFMKELWNNNSIDYDNARLVPYNVYGTVVRLYVPLDYAARIQATADVTCNCTSGTSGCTHEDVMKGFIKVGDKCDADDCHSCRMEW